MHLILFNAKTPFIVLEQCFSSLLLLRHSNGPKTFQFVKVSTKCNLVPPLWILMAPKGFELPRLKITALRFLNNWTGTINYLWKYFQATIILQ